MIVARGVAYDYPTARVLHDVSFEVAEGEVLALVGPNGAGKTTLLRCMAALEAPAEGRISIAGLDTQADPRGVHAALGYLPDFYGLYDQLSVGQALVYAARAHGAPHEAALAAAGEAAERVQLADRMGQPAGQLSRGLRQRLAIAQALAHQPRVLLLDEPAAGLDPEARRSLSDLIRRLAGEGMTIVVSSHILAELEDYCTRMLMLREGRIAGGGVVSAHAPSVEDLVVEVELAAPREGLAQALAGLGLEAEGVSAQAFRLRLSAGAEAEALAQLVRAGLAVRAFTPQRRSLEQAYLDQARKAQPPREAPP